MNRFLLSIILVAVFGSRLLSQSGCTDTQASNYNPQAVSNDGSCQYSSMIQHFTLKVNTINVGSNSGIEWINGGIYTFGDSGDPPTFFKIDTVTGNILQNITVGNYTNNDWEDITADSAYVYIGDFGNNNGTRTNLKILKIDKAQFVNTPSVVITVTAQAINFAYADQTSFAANSSNNFDCEAMINIKDSLYIFTKDRGDFHTRVYRLPKTPGSYTISPYTSYNVNGKITGADYNPNNNEVVLIGYMSGDMNSFIYYLYDFKGTDFFSGNKRRVELGNTNYAWQTEGIAFYNETSKSRIFISNEVNGVTAGIWVSDTNINVGIKENEAQPDGVKIYPNPSSDSFEIECREMIEKIVVMTMDGKTVFSDTAEQTKYSLNASQYGFPGGCYILKVQTGSGSIYRKLIFNP